MILVAILLPPLAVLICGKPVQALINCVLCLFLWVPGIVHAIMVVNARNADRRQAELIAAQNAAVAAQTAAILAAQGPTPPTPPTT